jgi:hypothetical protein
MYLDWDNTVACLNSIISEESSSVAEKNTYCVIGKRICNLQLSFSVERYGKNDIIFGVDVFDVEVEETKARFRGR